jgi:hypothetical protein
MSRRQVDATRGAIPPPVRGRAAQTRRRTVRSQEHEGSRCQAEQVVEPQARRLVRTLSAPVREDNRPAARARGHMADMASYSCYY